MAAIIISKATGLLSWAKTSSILRENAAHLYPFIIGEWDTHTFDFGIGAEAAVRCPECNRWIPVVTSTVDHQVPQTLMVQSQVSIMPSMERERTGWEDFKYNGDKFIVFDQGPISLIYSETGKTKRANYTIHKNRRTILINNTTLSYDIISVIKNNLSNLQYMCHSCNARKGAR